MSRAQRPNLTAWYANYPFCKLAPEHNDQDNDGRDEPKEADDDQYAHQAFVNSLGLGHGHCVVRDLVAVDPQTGVDGGRQLLQVLARIVGNCFGW